jgi:hypothetical protein
MENKTTKKVSIYTLVAGIALGISYLLGLPVVDYATEVWSVFSNFTGIEQPVKQPQTVVHQEDGKKIVIKKKDNDTKTCAPEDMDENFLCPGEEGYHKE